MHFPIHQERIDWGGTDRVPTDDGVPHEGIGAANGGEDETGVSDLARKREGGGLDELAGEEGVVDGAGADHGGVDGLESDDGGALGDKGEQRLGLYRHCRLIQT